ncbi:hypothetical protein HU200_027951 [Digitaria exilis]|uniref:F-box protein n=1 Tax=Digitaria exilis TaxID=1010633 RepID=A0A835BV53_9POAL|nr:hypothetical protein HU200_027951 [Digitaria exilis]
MPPYALNAYAGAVLCAVDGCDHLDCHAGPFLVVFVGTPSGLETWVSIYSSETGVWGPSVSIDTGFNQVDGKRSLLIGDALYFSLGYGVSILKYDLGRHELSEIKPLPVFGPVIFMEVEDGALGFVSELNNCIYMWVRQADANGTRRWEEHMVMELETVLPRPATQTTYEVVGFVEGTDTIFISGSHVGVFMLDLKSRKVKKVGESGAYFFILPYMSFYTPGIKLCFFL